MKQKLFSWGDDFTIKNEAGDDVFFVDGKAFSLGKKLSFQDMGKNELAFIRQKLLAWGPTYEITRAGAPFEDNRFDVVVSSLAIHNISAAPAG